MGPKKKPDKNLLVVQLESDIIVRHSRLTKLSYRIELGYFIGRAGLVRIINLAMAITAVLLLTPGFKPEIIEPTEQNIEMLRLMGYNKNFSGYVTSKYTLISMGLGSIPVLISLINVILLFFFMEVRYDIMWLRINQKGCVIACASSVFAAICNAISLQQTQVKNCGSIRCRMEKFDTKVTKYEEEFYPPYFLLHYTAFVCYLANAMLYSIASRMWLRNDD